nr:basic helix-loop-helix transcription factor [Loropetalum chinense var. rubrum]WIE96095.1 basic helix-loop-helix transcription factor [Loropetalum chinense var. rubrum]WIE96096.1 basic helix-loop-helix transcription factor [Loropetalum chinense var. rubrum]
MDITSAKWLSELGMEDYEDPTAFINECQMNSFDHEFKFKSFSSETYSSYPNFDQKPSNLSGTTSSIKTCHTDHDNIVEKPAAKQVKMDGWMNSCTTQQHIAPKAAASSSSQIISFENSNSLVPTSQHLYGNLECNTMPYKNNKMVSQGNINNFRSHEKQKYLPNSGQGTQKMGVVMTKNPLHAQDHVIAERKRREKLSLKFIALSALIPGLKKMDKASVLGDAIKHLKHLQERVKILEEQTAKKTMESVVVLKRSRLSVDDDYSSSSDENFVSRSDQPLPEIEVRVSEKDVLINIHCEQNKGFIVKILSAIEKLHLIVTNSSVLPFGNYAMDITVVAQMEADFSMTVKDLVRNLRQAFLNFM